MMPGEPTKRKKPIASPTIIFVCALFLAFMLHILVFEIFTFSFQLREASLKPKLVFLGPILQGEEISGEDFTPDATIRKKYSAKVSVAEVNGPRPFNEVEVPKPHIMTGKKILDKPFLKSTFNEATPKPADLPDNLGIDTDARTYKPLKLPAQ